MKTSKTMVENKELLTHLTGYTSIALILGTANWSGIGVLFTIPIAFATVLLGLYMAYNKTVEKAKVEVKNNELTDYTKQ